MGYLVDQHPELVRAEYGLSEGGGTTVYLGGKALYDVRTAEKGTCRFHLRARGNPGHGSVPREETAITRVAAAVLKLAGTSLPFRATPTLVAFFDRIGEMLNLPAERRKLTEENLRLLMDQLPAGFGQYLRAVTHDTAVPTGMRAGQKINVIPSEAVAWVDGRYLPGQTEQGFMDEVRAVVGEGYELERMDLSRPLEDPPGGPLFDSIVSVMARHDPDAPVAPLMLSGATDAKHVSRLGTHCLGFGPVRVPEDFPADQLVHGHDERIPIDGYVWGMHVLHDIVVDFCR
jgi:acetylornithine deacetylase/succinyl-diaminopimelate desuccinylase-like protein